MDVHLDSFTIIFPWFLIVFLALYGLYQRIGEVEETILYQIQSTNAVQGAEEGVRETEDENYEYYNKISKWCLMRWHWAYFFY